MSELDSLRKKELENETLNKKILKTWLSTCDECSIECDVGVSVRTKVCPCENFWLNALGICSVAECNSGLNKTSTDNIDTNISKKTLQLSKKEFLIFLHLNFKRPLCKSCMCEKVIEDELHIKYRRYIWDMEHLCINDVLFNARFKNVHPSNFGICMYGNSMLRRPSSIVHMLKERETGSINTRVCNDRKWKREDLYYKCPYSWGETGDIEDKFCEICKSHLTQYKVEHRRDV